MADKQKRWKRFLSLTGNERHLFIESFLLHLWVGLLVKVIPFRWIARLFTGHPSSVSGMQSEEIESVKRAIQRAGSISPWKNRCLVSSLVGRSMLNRRNIPSQLSLGVSKDAGGRTVAHAWLISGTVDVTGKQGDFQELFVF